MRANNAQYGPTDSLDGSATCRQAPAKRATNPGHRGSRLKSGRGMGVDGMRNVW